MNKHHLIAAALAVVAIAPTAAPPPASAAGNTGTFTEFLCSDPDNGHSLGGPDGLTGISNTTDWLAGTGGGACATIAPHAVSAVPAGSYAALHYEVTDPALTIASAEHYSAVTAETSPGAASVVVRQHASTHYGDPAAVPAGADVAAAGALNRGLPGSPFAQANRFATIVDPQHRQFTISVICAPPDGTSPCSQMLTTWRYLFFAARIVLRDTTAPTVSGVTGTAVAASSLNGWGKVSFSVTDEGSGSYRMITSADSEVIATKDLSHDLDGCRDVNGANADPYEFASQHPCPANRLVTDAVVDVSGLSEGPHQISAVVEDAAGNRDTIFDRMVTVDNIADPSLSTVAVGDPHPAITGSPAVGALLTATGGWWTAGEPYTYAYAWERCDLSGACTPIPGAAGLTYVPSAADAGSRLRIAVTAKNSANEPHTERSVETDAVTAPATHDGGGSSQPPATPIPTPAVPTALLPDHRSPSIGTGPGGVLPPAVAAGRLTVELGGKATRHTSWSATVKATGRLLDSAGAPIGGAAITVVATESRPGAHGKTVGHTTTKSNGTFTYPIGHGSSRAITFTYGDAKATVHTIVPAQLTLKVGRARIARTTWLTGHLAHLPRAGVKLEVQALDGKRWRTFDTTKTKKAGTYKYGYRFKPSAAGRTFALRVLVDSPTYPFARAASRAARVRVSR